MAQPRLIDAYLVELRRQLRRRVDLEDLLAEAEDHLREAAEAAQRAGLPAEAAERSAVISFGAVDVVGAAFANNGKGATVPTIFTRLSGLAAIVATPLFVLGFALVSQDASDPVHWVGGTLIAVAVACLVTCVVGLRQRHGPALGREGRIAKWVAFASPALALPFAWGAPFALAGFLGLSLVLMAIGMFRAGILPRPAIALLVLGIPAGLAVGAAGIVLDRDTASGVPLVAVPLLAIGLVWIGYRLWNEQPVSRSGAPLSA